MILEQLKTYLESNRFTLDGLYIAEVLRRELSPVFLATLRKLHQSKLSYPGAVYAIKRWLELAGLARLELGFIDGTNASCFYFKCSSGAVRTSMCSKCKQVNYCSPDCQSRYGRMIFKLTCIMIYVANSDWKDAGHKEFCKAFSGC